MTDEKTQFSSPAIVKVQMIEMDRENGDDEDAEIQAFSIQEDGSVNILHDAQVTFDNGIATFKVWHFSL